MKKVITLLLFFLVWSQVFSQEKSIYINDYLAPHITNPAYTGAEYYPVANLSIKKQWLGFSESPTTLLLAGNYRIGTHDFYNPKGLVNKGPLKLKDRVGIGMAIFQDNDGPLINNGGLISYAYHLPVNRKSRLSLGMSMILINHRISTSMLEPYDNNDSFLLSEENGGTKLNFGTGVYYYNSTYFFGLSANKLLRDISNANEETRNTISYFFTGGYKFFKQNKYINLEPSFSLKKINNQQIIFNIYSKVYINRLNWIAISYSSFQQLNTQFAIRLYKKIYAGYNYGFTIGKIAEHNLGSHEVSLGVNLGLVGVKGIRKLANKR